MTTKQVIEQAKQSNPLKLELYDRLLEDIYENCGLQLSNKPGDLLSRVEELVESEGGQKLLANLLGTEYVHEWFEDFESSL